MAAAANAQLDALSALLASAQELAKSLSGDASVRRIVAAVTGLTPEERQLLASAMERAIAWRRVNDAVCEMSGVRLRVNPNPSLFLRVIDAEASATSSLPDPDEVLPGTLRLMRRAPLLVMPEAQAVWKPAALEAFGLLSPAERAACLAFVHAVAALLDAAAAPDDGGTG